MAPIDAGIDSDLMRATALLTPANYWPFAPKHVYLASHSGGNAWKRLLLSVKQPAFPCVQISNFVSFLQLFNPTYASAGFPFTPREGAGKKCVFFRLGPCSQQL